MTVDGIPATSVRATIAVHDGVPKFEAHAEGLAGTFTVKGSGRLGQCSKNFAIEADARAVGLQLASLCDVLEMSSTPMARIRGLGAVTARVTTGGSAASTQAEGSVEVRDLQWGETCELGDVSAGFTITPNYWRVGNLTGALWDGPIHGEFWRRTHGHDPAQYGLDLRLERISLARVFAFEPGLGRRFDGSASFIAQGHTEGSFRGRGEIRVEHGRVHRLPIVGLSIPIDWDIKPEKDLPGKIQIRKASARVAGGRLYGDAIVHLGPRRDIHAELTFEQIDMRAISGAEGLARRPMPGVIDGVITLDSRNIAWTEDYTGVIDVDLTKAALVDIPILDCLDSALGSAQAAVFEDGAFHGRIAHRAIHVERLTLVGPLAQLHATGTIGFDGRLDLRRSSTPTTSSHRTAGSQSGRLANVVEGVLTNEQAIERMGDLLSSRLMKFRIRGTVTHPLYSIDESIHIDRTVIGFFIDAMRDAASRATR